MLTFTCWYEGWHKGGERVGEGPGPFLKRRPAGRLCTAQLPVPHGRQRLPASAQPQVSGAAVWRSPALPGPPYKAATCSPSHYQHTQAARAHTCTCITHARTHMYTGTHVMLWHARTHTRAQKPSLEFKSVRECVTP